MNMIMLAAELCMTAVKTADTAATSMTPQTEPALSIPIACESEADAFTGSTPCFMKCIPRNTRPRPTSARPTCLTRPRRNEKYPSAPSVRAPSPSNSGLGANAMSQIVNVVPMFAPISTLMDSTSVMRRDTTKPTSITVTMDDDCIKSAAAIPVATPDSRLPVANDMKCLRPSPLAAWSPSERCRIPSRNRPSPPHMLAVTGHSSFIVDMSCVGSLVGLCFARYCSRCRYLTMLRTSSAGEWRSSGR